MWAVWDCFEICFDKMHVRLGSFSQEKHLRSRMHLFWWQYNWDIEEIFWSFLSLGFQSISQPETRRSASSFFWNEDQCCNSNTVVAFQRVQDAAKSKGLEFILKAIMKTSHSLIPSFLFFGFYSQPKKGRELGSHPVNVNKVKCMTVTLGFTEMNRSDQWDQMRFIQSSSWIHAGSKSCHCQELSGTGSTVIPRWDLPSLQPWQSFLSVNWPSCLSTRHLSRSIAF